jgi:phosphoheptose isomerase
VEITDAIRKAKRVYVCGNGGSASTANHFVNDLVKMCKIRAYSLCSNEALLTALANDNGYENVFLDQLKVYAEQGDLVITISTSGRSSNILSAIRWTSLAGIECITFPVYDTTITVSEDWHLELAHKICENLNE